MNAESDFTAYVLLIAGNHFFQISDSTVLYCVRVCFCLGGGCMRVGNFVIQVVIMLRKCVNFVLFRYMICFILI